MGQPCLFGWPEMPWKGKRGKPPHLPTPENVNKIKLLLAVGKTNLQISQALGISEPTLRKHYLSVLKVRLIAREAAEARLLELQWSQAEKGNVGAMKMLEGKFDALRRADRIKAAMADDEDGDEERPTKTIAAPARTYVGKREQERQRAAAALASDPDLMSRMN